MSYLSYVSQKGDTAWGRMPGGAAGQLATFEQHHIGDADFRQVIGDRTAGDPAANDHDAGTIWR